MVKTLRPKLPPATLQKLQARIKEQDAIRQQARQSRAEKLQSNQQLAQLNAEKHLEEHLAAEKLQREYQTQAKERGDFWVQAEPKVLLIIRIKGVNKLPPKVKKVFQLFRLKQINNAVFIKNNKATLQMLRLIEPWVTFGYPSRSTISRLLYKRGFVKIDKQRRPLTDNAQILDSLGSLGISSVEDVIREIHLCGEQFKKVNNFLWPFKLSTPKGGFVHKCQSYIKGGDWGNREAEINKLVRRML